ncbi:unnamed protein product (mitochondrion) [Plasmodiophora brassicae]|uniref:Uncharacterized protein n=1 Tax=Plasmodiophora brassicae TaxID=37360 RepID=A0A0G4J5A4_PLABS|nr:hypothetical protein PBRA_009158 [Plasmodiophora brassicae]SPQ98453.1 unnamed protein product [Plasmodiophora brassicae]
MSTATLTVIDIDPDAPDDSSGSVIWLPDRQQAKDSVGHRFRCVRHDLLLKTLTTARKHCRDLHNGVRIRSHPTQQPIRAKHPLPRPCEDVLRYIRTLWDSPGQQQYRSAEVALRRLRNDWRYAIACLAPGVSCASLVEQAQTLIDNGSKGVDVAKQSATQSHLNAVSCWLGCVEGLVDDVHALPSWDLSRHPSDWFLQPRRNPRDLAVLQVVYVKLVAAYTTAQHPIPFMTRARALQRQQECVQRDLRSAQALVTLGAVEQRNEPST